MVRIGERGTSVPGNNRKGRRALARMRRFFDSGNLGELIKQARKLSQGSARVSSRDLSVAYALVCSLAARKGQFVTVVEYALKIFQLNPDSPTREDAGMLIAEVLWIWPQLDLSTHEEITAKLRIFTQKKLNKDSTTSMSAPEALIWLGNLQRVFPREFLSYQLRLAEIAFAGLEDQAAKGDVAQAYLLIARRMGGFPDQEAAVQRVREKADFLVDNCADAIRDAWDEETFHCFIIDLEYFKFWELQDRAVSIRQPAPKNPVLLYLKLSRGLREDIGVTYRELMRIIPLSGGTNPTIDGELNVLVAKIARAHLENCVRDASALPPLPTPQSWFDRVLSEPSREQPSIIAKIRNLRSIFFRALNKVIADGEYLWMSAGYPADLSSERGRVNLVYVPDSGVLEMYFGEPVDGGVLKICYPVIRDQNGNPHAASAKSFFAGVGREEQTDVPVFWDLFSFASAFNIIRTLLSDGSREMVRLELKFDELTRDIKKAAYPLFERENLAAYVQLKAAFSKVKKLNASLLQLKNEMVLSRKIFDEFVSGLATRTYALEPSDFLYPLISEVLIIAPHEVGDTFGEPLYLDAAGKARMSGEISAKAPIGVVFKSKTGEKIFALLRSPESLEILGRKNQTEDRFQIYLTQLALEACAKLFTPNGPCRNSVAGGGYILDPEDALDVSSGTPPEGPNALAEIYRVEFYARLANEGLTASRWFYREEAGRDNFLYRPLGDQSSDGKRAALGEKGAENVFVQVEPNGIVCRLPVRLKRTEQGLVPAPYERHPLREEQQTLLGDTQPLPVLYGLYIVTTFSNGLSHLRLFALRKTEEEILDSVLDEAQREIDSGSLMNPTKLLQGTREQRRKELKRQLTSGEVTITRQDLDIFKLQTTFRRPRMTSVAALIEDGLPLRLPK